MINLSTALTLLLVWVCRALGSSMDAPYVGYGSPDTFIHGVRVNYVPMGISIPRGRPSRSWLPMYTDRVSKVNGRWQQDDYTPEPKLCYCGVTGLPPNHDHDVMIIEERNFMCDPDHFCKGKSCITSGYYAPDNPDIRPMVMRRCVTDKFSTNTSTIYITDTEVTELGHMFGTLQSSFMTTYREHVCMTEKCNVPTGLDVDKWWTDYEWPPALEIVGSGSSRPAAMDLFGGIALAGATATLTCGLMGQ